MAVNARRLPLLLALLAAVVAAKPKDYTGYRLVDVQPHTTQQIKVLQALNDIPGVSVWEQPSSPGHVVQFSVAPEVYDDVTGSLIQAGLEPVVTLENLQSQIDLERKLNNLQKEADFDKFKYNKLSDINAYLDSLAAKHDFCEVFSIGKSFEGRDMKVLKIGGANTTQRVWIDGGIHAREWISPATVIYIIDELVTGYSSDASIRDLVERITWYILPVMNPDGYEYTFTDERLWRKTRSFSEGDFCVGTDANRNFDFHWMEGGASTNPCSEIFAGSRPFSEIEARNVATFLTQTTNVGVYLTFHSYGQLWLVPWGYTRDQPADYDELEAKANIAAAAIKRNSGETYRVGQTTRILYVAAGGSDDWAKGAAGIKYSYTIELRDSGRYGFLLPPSEISPTGRENWAGVSAMINAIWPRK